MLLYMIDKAFLSVYLALTADVKLWLLFSQLGLLQADVCGGEQNLCV